MFLRVMVFYFILFFKINYTSDFEDFPGPEAALCEAEGHAVWGWDLRGGRGDLAAAEEAWCDGVGWECWEWDAMGVLGMGWDGSVFFCRPRNLCLMGIAEGVNSRVGFFFSCRFFSISFSLASNPAVQEAQSRQHDGSLRRQIHDCDGMNLLSYG
jgi:hypothetical protein